MNSFHSQIPIITQSNEINSTPTGLVETSAHTTQLSRHALICFETRPSTIKLPSEVHDTSNKLTCEIEDYDNFKYIFKDNAITISDVSVHYVQTSKIGDKIQNDFPLECLADSTKTAVFNNEFINLEREISPWSISEMEDIEKTRLSLVETLLSESDDAEEGAKQNLKEPEKELSDNISSQHNPGESCLASLRKESKIDVHENVNYKEFCRQCKNCQGVLTCESVLSASESFALPTMTPFAPIGFECLAKLRKRPKLKHIHAYWRRRSLEKKEDNLSTFVEQGAELDEEQNRDFYNRCHRKDFESRIEFLKRKVLPNWVLNSQMAARGIIQLRHTNFISFAIEILYEDRSQLGNPIFIKDISLQSGRIPSVLWKPIDHLLNFTLKMSLPLDLKSLCKFDTSANFVLGLLQHVDKVCTQALEDGINLWRLLINERANLTRDASRLIVRKITSEVVHKGADYYPFVNRTEFQIELTNIHTLSFRDIIFPPLHAFCEELQVLPSGIDFLKVFLKSPSTYLRS
ncbi:uncharacterized protein LOC118733321 isoform X2 [Rhagoletis pomonella]|uniref:uncharacterized protein LOC118733321 isoform X2 n=1 Tax=Rhagoletis pomonella TaxID=28610 RepID=UPI00177D2E9F|nr:uncharacterized protein LOC118733321 isoform X2 [Rhagoletis pomonella]